MRVIGWMKWIKSIILNKVEFCWCAEADAARWIWQAVGLAGGCWKIRSGPSAGETRRREFRAQAQALQAGTQELFTTIGRLTDPRQGILDDSKQGG